MALIRKPIVFWEAWLMIAVGALSFACGSPASEPPEPTSTSVLVVESALAQQPSPTPALVVESALAEEPSPVPASTPDAAPAAQASPSPSPSTGSAAPTPLDPEFKYDPDINMFLILSGAGHPLEYSLVGLEMAQDNGDRSQVPVILEALQFISSPLVQDTALETLKALTGQDFGGRERLRLWREWMWAHAEDFQPPEMYVRWKANLLAFIDPRMAELVLAAESKSRIDLTEVVWGGVGLDGIPPLENPPSIAAGEADYLLPDDRVFGVSINGEHRAYPLRIMNPHEMANDVLGGEPISLAY